MLVVSNGDGEASLHVVKVVTSARVRFALDTELSLKGSVAVIKRSGAVLKSSVAVFKFAVSFLESPRALLAVTLFRLQLLHLL